MSDFPLQKITIYHKNENNVYERYVKDASFRNTSMLNQKNYGFSNSDKAIVRVFDVDMYNNSVYPDSPILNFPLDRFLGKTWKVQKGDVIVNGSVFDEIEGETPLTILSQKYGKENVYKINSINVFIFNDQDIEEINHIKLGCI